MVSLKSRERKCVYAYVRQRQPAFGGVGTARHNQALVDFVHPSRFLKKTSICRDARTCSHNSLHIAHLYEHVRPLVCDSVCNRFYYIFSVITLVLLQSLGNTQSPVDCHERLVLAIKCEWTTYHRRNYRVSNKLSYWSSRHQRQHPVL